MSTSSGAVLSSFYSDVVFFEGGGIPRPHYLILRQGKMFCAQVLDRSVVFSKAHREKNRIVTFGSLHTQDLEILLPCEVFQVEESGPHTYK